MIQGCTTLKGSAQRSATSIMCAHPFGALMHLLVGGSRVMSRLHLVPLAHRHETRPHVRDKSSSTRLHARFQEVAVRLGLHTARERQGSRHRHEHAREQGASPSPPTTDLLDDTLCAGGLVGLGRMGLEGTTPRRHFRMRGGVWDATCPGVLRAVLPAHLHKLCDDDCVLYRVARVQSRF
jgi:hypothetical protein